MDRTEFYRVVRYDSTTGAWFPVLKGDYVPEWEDAVRVYDHAKGLHPSRRHRITHHVVTVTVVQDDEDE